MKCETPFTLYHREGDQSVAQLMPCGHCDPCKNNQKNEWMYRHYLEREYGFGPELSSFVTLTLAPESVSYTSDMRETLDPDDVTKFIKRLRKRALKYYGVKIRYHYVGEYGDKSGRPHYHLIIYGLNPIQAEYECLRAWSVLDENIDSELSITQKQRKYGYSDHHRKMLIGRRPLGRVKVGDSNGDQTTEYVLGYCLKSETNETDWRRKHPGDTRHPEFARMSRNPGIGHEGAKAIAAHLARNRQYIEEYPQTNLWGATGIPVQFKPVEVRVAGKVRRCWPCSRYIQGKVLTTLGVAQVPMTLDQKRLKIAEKYLDEDRIKTVEEHYEAVERETASKAARQRLAQKIKKRESGII